MKMNRPKSSKNTRDEEMQEDTQTEQYHSVASDQPDVHSNESLCANRDEHTVEDRDPEVSGNETVVPTVTERVAGDEIMETGVDIQHDGLSSNDLITPALNPANNTDMDQPSADIPGPSSLIQKPAHSAESYKSDNKELIKILRSPVKRSSVYLSSIDLWKSDMPSSAPPESERGSSEEDHAYEPGSSSELDSPDDSIDKMEFSSCDSKEISADTPSTSNEKVINLKRKREISADSPATSFYRPVKKLKTMRGSCFPSESSTEDAYSDAAGTSASAPRETKVMKRKSGHLVEPTTAAHYRTVKKLKTRRGSLTKTSVKKTFESSTEPQSTDTEFSDMNPYAFIPDYSMEDPSVQTKSEKEPTECTVEEASEPLECTVEEASEPSECTVEEASSEPSECTVEEASSESSECTLEEASSESTEGKISPESSESSECTLEEESSESTEGKISPESSECTVEEISSESSEYVVEEQSSEPAECTVEVQSSDMAEPSEED